MSKICRSSFLLLAAVLLAGPASALTLSPDPVSQVRGGGDPGGPLDAEVSFVSIVGDTLSVQLTVNTGSITQLDFSFLGSPSIGGPVFNFTSGGAVVAAGSEIGGTATDLFGTEVQVVFDESVDAGESSGVISITFQNAIAAGFEGAITFDNGAASDELYAVIAVPEASALLLLGGALAGLARRRS